MTVAVHSLLASTGTTTFVLVAILLLMSLTMALVARWLLHVTRVDPPALGPLETMGERRFRRREGSARASVLATARPPGAPDPAPMLDIEDAPAAEVNDSADSSGPGDDIEVEVLHRYSAGHG